MVSSPLSAVLSEPASIAAEASTVEAELTNLCFREYSTFVSVHQCSAAVQSAFDDFDGSLKRLIDSVPGLENECRTFTKRTSGVQAVRARALAVQEQRDKLQDLLELPQLMETCVRNGYYQEALELAQHASALKGRYSSLVLVQDVVHEVEHVVQLMLSQLLALLREPVKLPSIVKAITFLRRLGKIDEDDLGLIFLTSRLHNFRSQLVHIERDRADPTRYLRRYIDLFREHVYDIISQYSTIFSHSAQVISFASQCVGDLISLAKSYIPRISSDTAAMSSILVQLGYCALSFARIGLDFASLLGNSFADTISATFHAGAADAADAFVKALGDATRSAAPPSEVLVAPSQIANVLNTDMSLDQVVDGAPPDLALFPPLAVFVNAHLSLLNSLRLLAPVHLFRTLQRVQEYSVVRSTDALLSYLWQATSNETRNGDSEKPKHQRTPSSPRAHLLRRSTDAQMPLEMFSAKKKEAARLCLSFALAWRITCFYLARCLQEGIFGERREAGTALARSLAKLDAFIERQTVNGTDSQPPWSAAASATAKRPESEGYQALAPTLLRRSSRTLDEAVARLSNPDLDITSPSPSPRQANVHLPHPPDVGSTPAEASQSLAVVNGDLCAEPARGTLGGVLPALADEPFETSATNESTRTVATVESDSANPSSIVNDMFVAPTIPHDQPVDLEESILNSSAREAVDIAVMPRPEPEGRVDSVIVTGNMVTNAVDEPSGRKVPQSANLERVNSKADSKSSLAISPMASPEPADHSQRIGDVRQVADSPPERRSVAESIVQDGLAESTPPVADDSESTAPRAPAPLSPMTAAIPSITDKTIPANAQETPMLEGDMEEVEGPAPAASPSEAAAPDETSRPDSPDEAENTGAADASGGTKAKKKKKKRGKR